ncbi:MAG: permease [Calditrichia bacterium]
MNWKQEYKPFLWIIGFFLFAYYMPLENGQFSGALLDAFHLAKWYAQEHVLFCLIPAFFIAGTIAVFISQAAVIKYFGAQTAKWVSYAIAAVSGSILAVCSCTVLPLFAGIHKRGAGLGPAIAFLYSGPAINILAIILTARILGLELGIARVVGAVSFSVIIGLIMHFIYRKEETEKAAAQLSMPGSDEGRPIWQTAFHFFILVAILIFATWGKPDSSSGFWYLIYSAKWWLVAFFGLLLAVSLVTILKIKPLRVIFSAIPVLLLALLFPHTPAVTFSAAIVILIVLLSASTGEPQEWMSSTWGFTKQILPLLGAGVLVAGFFLGAPDGGNGIIPNNWITVLVGGNSFFSNFFASVVGAFMYFATLTEVPILQGLLAGGMGKGPALALLLAGPALSLPNMLVIRSVMGTRKTVVFVSLVVVMATASGLIFGKWF